MKQEETIYTFTIQPFLVQFLFLQFGKEFNILYFLGGGELDCLVALDVSIKMIGIVLNFCCLGIQ